MSKFGAGTWIAVVLTAWLVSAGAALAGERTAEEILRELDAVKVPLLDRAKRGDNAYIKEFFDKRHEAVEKRAALILELYKAAPAHERIPTLMTERWTNMSSDRAKGKHLKKEIHDVL